MKRVGIEHARSDMAETVDTARVVRTMITRRGRGVASIVSVDEGRLLEWMEETGALAEAMEAFRRTQG